MYGLQAPATQTLPVAHAVPQAPQWVGSVWVLAHAPEQSVRLPQPRSVHDPALHSPMPHPVPHVPQFLGSVWRLTQLPLHAVSGARQVAVQAPFTHVLPPVHCVPQPLQYWGSVSGLTHAWPPVTGQSSGVVVLQVASHEPLAHFGAPVEAPEIGWPHTVLQPPQ